MLVMPGVPHYKHNLCYDEGGWGNTQRLVFYYFSFWMLKHANFNFVFGQKQNFTENIYIYKISVIAHMQ